MSPSRSPTRGAGWPERLPHLFSKHTGAGQDATAGHGLGLAICKGLVEAHGGRIRAESPGAGRTMVTFTVPVAGEAGAAVAGHAAVAPAAPEPGEPPRILVVHDDPQMPRRPGQPIEFHYPIPPPAVHKASRPHRRRNAAGRPQRVALVANVDPEPNGECLTTIRTEVPGRGSRPAPPRDAARRPRCPRELLSWSGPTRGPTPRAGYQPI